MNNFGKKLADKQYQHRKIIATVVYNSFRNSNVDSKSRLDTCMELVTKKSMQTKPKLIQFGFMTHRINHAISWYDYHLEKTKSTFNRVKLFG